MWTSYKQSLTSAREFDHECANTAVLTLSEEEIWHTIFICPAFENPYSFLFNVNVLLFIVRYVDLINKINVIP